MDRVVALAYAGTFELEPVIDQHFSVYEPGDVETPALILQSIRDADGRFRASRAGLPPTEIPNFLTLVRNKSAIITN